MPQTIKVGCRAGALRPISQQAQNHAPAKNEFAARARRHLWAPRRTCAARHLRRQLQGPAQRNAAPRRLTRARCRAALSNGRYKAGRSGPLSRWRTPSRRDGLKVNLALRVRRARQRDRRQRRRACVQAQRASVHAEPDSAARDRAAVQASKLAGSSTDPAIPIADRMRASISRASSGRSFR